MTDTTSTDDLVESLPAAGLDAVAAVAPTRSWRLILTITVTAGMAMALLFAWTISNRAIDDGHRADLRRDLTSLREGIAADPQRLSPDGLRDLAIGVEYSDLLVVTEDSTLVHAVGSTTQAPAVPEGTVPETLAAGTSATVTFDTRDGLTTGYLVLGVNEDDGSAFVLGLRRAAAPSIGLALFLVPGALAVAAILLIALPTARSRDRLLEQQSAAVAGLVRSKADALRKANGVERVKSDFLTAISHRFRTPLQVIRGMASLLSDPDKEVSPEMARTLARRLDRSAKELDQLLGDLLDVDRLIRGGVEPSRSTFNVTGAVNQVARELAQGDRIVLRGDAVEGNVDAAHLDRMVEHLLRNALEHSPAGEVVEVTVTRDEKAFLVEVADRGPGIEKEHRLRVFDPLYRIEEDASNPGTGVGLALVQRLAGAHGGRAWNEQRQGGGSRFFVRIPDEGHDKGVDLWQLSGNMAS